MCIYFFFFQAEDGIRDYKVTGVQTCALPIYFLLLHRGQQQADGAQAFAVLGAHGGLHVFGDLGLEAHGISPEVVASENKNQKTKTKNPRLASRARVLRLTRAGWSRADQYSFLGSCMLRTRL